jgi:hypothetical protein
MNGHEYSDLEAAGLRPPYLLRHVIAHAKLASRLFRICPFAIFQIDDVIYGPKGQRKLEHEEVTACEPFSRR